VQTPMMLDLLDRHGVSATFFMIGRNVERHPDVVRQVLARGHEVGNHSYTHPKMIFMWPSAVREEIERTDRALRDAGASGDILFRPPHAAKFVVLPYVLTTLGKTSVLGDVDPEEWKRPGAAVMTASVLKQVRPGSILGFHDPMGEDTRRTVDAVLTTLLADGYRIEAMSAFLKRRARPSDAPSAARR
jgi:peptidoglycan/xylan/chitin deacetylase (PgdA/CDA1 family)